MLCAPGWGQWGRAGGGPHRARRREAGLGGRPQQVGAAETGTPDMGSCNTVLTSRPC